MPYVKKDDDGNIIALSEVELEGFEPLQAFSGTSIADLIKGMQQAQDALADTDMEFVRVIEDLVMLLVDQNQIRFTDLPEAAQRKMLERQRIRDVITPYLNLLPDEDNDGLI